MSKPTTRAFEIRPEWNAQRPIQYFVTGDRATIRRWTGSEWIYREDNATAAGLAWVKCPLARTRLVERDGSWVAA